ncbi:MAG: NAD+ synthase [Chitinophagales bacterium]|nr:NAD+ synthase [Chitinophagales bacterium]HRP40311.1 NAD+ synthase [Chitinophagales bacterium]
MKITIAQLNFQVGNFELNVSKIIDAAQQAVNENADLVVFSELSICGYPARDFLTYEQFVEECNNALDRIAAANLNVGILVGAPVVNIAEKGKKLFNAAVFIHEGKVKQVFHKALLPTYDVFDEYRYFEPNSTFELLHFKGKKIAVTICEDIWNVGNKNPLYKSSPLDKLILLQPDFVVNLSASPFSYTQQHERLQVLKANVARYQIPFVYVNQIGAQTELIFDGGSMVLQKDGNSLVQLPVFEEKIETVNVFEEVKTSTEQQIKEPIELIHTALVLGIRDYFKKLGFKKAILGLSGGIDSALVLQLAVEALGNENVFCLLLPSQFSSQHSIDDALQLCSNLQVKHETISIQPIFEKLQAQTEPFFKDLPFNVTEENMQARARGILLMAFSNKFGYILLNTTNKSEAAVGYGTLYGDMCGGISVLGDVYKTQVYELAKWINRNGEIIPENIITKAPSAELRPNQKDSDSLPEYDLLDKILFAYIEECKDAAEIMAQGFDESTVKRTLRMVNMNEWKRFQAAPILRVSPKAFGMGRRMPIEGNYKPLS